MTATISGRPPAGGRPRQSRTDRLTTAWMVLALLASIAVLVGHENLPQTWWTIIHLVTLGVLTNGILQWSWYFSRSLLRMPPDSRHSGRDQTIRQIIFNACLIELIAAMWLANTMLVVAGAVGIGLTLSWHGVALIWAMRSRLGSRFAVIIRYYVAAAAFLVIGSALAALVATTLFSVEAPELLLASRSNLTFAHAIVNFLGWIGLSITGTIVTLGPTILRTRMVSGAVDRAVAALPVLVVALVGMATAATLGITPLVGAFLLIYLAGWSWGIGWHLILAFLQAQRWNYSTVNVAAGLIVGVATLGWWCVTLLLGETTHLVGTLHPAVIGLLGTGAILPIFIGALTYLLPVVLGGGPAAVKVGIAQAETWGAFRIVIRFAALTLAVTTPAPGLQSVWWLLVALTYLADIAIFVSVGIKQKRTKNAIKEQQRGERHD